MMRKRRWLKILLVFLPLFLVALQWTTDEVRPDNLMTNVPVVRYLPWLETNYAYLYLHIFTFVPVFLLSFDRRVRYFRNWRSLLPAVLIVGSFFIIWDVFFTARGVWGFNEEYLLGLKIWHLPVEEWLFFFTVPFACVFIYECLNYYFDPKWPALQEKGVTIALIILFLFFGLVRWDHMYTSTTFLLAGFFLLYHFLFIRGDYRGRFYSAYMVSWIPFLLVNGVLTGGYSNGPVVLYNPDEYFGIRITSVPLDDSVYSFLLILAVITFFESFRKKSNSGEPL